MISYAKRLTQSKFVRNIAIVATGTAGAQAIAMAFAPIITRIYGPEAFGVLGTFNAILAVLTPMAALSYPIAIVLPKRDSDAIELAKLSLKIALVMSLLTALLLALFKTSINDVLNLQAAGLFILMLPMAVLFSAALAVMSQWVIRKKLFKIKAKMAVLQAIWLNLAKVSIGLLFPSATVLIVLAAMGGAMHALMLWVGVRKSTAEDPALAGYKRDYVTITSKELAWQYRDFAYYRTPQAVLNAASQSMPVLILASFFGPAAAGLYALAKMVLGLPSTLIGKSVSDVFYPRFVEVLRSGENGRKLILKSCGALLLIGACPYLLMFVLGPIVFRLAFGDAWMGSGEFARWMAIWMLSVLVTRPIVTAIPALGLQLEFLIFEILSLVLRASSIALAYYLTGSAVLTVAVFSLTNVGLYFILFLYVVKKA